MKAAALAAANRRLRNRVRSSIGARERRSITTHSGSSTAAAARPAITTTLFQPLMPPFETPSTRPVKPTTKVQGPEHVEAADLVGLGQLAQDHRAPRRSGKGERDVEPEHPVPGDRHQCSAQHGPEHEPDGSDHRVRPHRQAELLAGKGVGHQRGGVGEQERRADSLQDPPQDQLACRWRRSRRPARRRRTARSRPRRRACGRTGRSGDRPSAPARWRRSGRRGSPTRARAGSCAGSARGPGAR